MGAYYTNELYYNLKVHSRSDGGDCVVFNAGRCDSIYITYVSKQNLTPFERYDVINCLENHEHENRIEIIPNESDGYTNNDKYYSIEDKSQPNNLNDPPHHTHPHAHPNMRNKF